MCRMSYRWLGIVLLALILVSCGEAANKGNNNAATPPSKGNDNAVTATAGVQLGKLDCPVAVSDPTHWDAIVGTQPNVNKVESVTCANLLGSSSLQALINVRSLGGTSSALDVYVYNNITGPNPTQVFKLIGLYKGVSKVSSYNTVMTGEVDQASQVNKTLNNASYQLDLYREFKWSDSADTLVPIAFPGLFPDLTRFESEKDQGQVNQGQDSWKLDASQVSLHLADRLLQWGVNTQATIVSGGGKSDGAAVVTVKHTVAAGGTVKISLSRLEGNTNGGLWVVTAVNTDGMAISAPQPYDRLASPQNVAGKGNAFEGVIGKVIVFDHTYTNIGQVNVDKVQPGNGAANFNASVTYKSTFKGGSQEGFLGLISYSNADGSIAGVVLVKAMISG